MKTKKSKTKLVVGDSACIFSTRIPTCSPSLVLRNWFLLYFSVKTKSFVCYHFLNIRIIFAVLRLPSRSCWHGEYQDRHPNRSHWKRRSLHDQCNDSCYNVPRLCNAVWSRRFGAGCIVEHSGTAWWYIFGHTRGVQLVLGLVFLQTSQVLPHWLNHHLSLILALYKEALSF